MVLEKELEEKINLARRGRDKWLQLMGQYVIDKNTYVILFPQEKTQCNRYVLKYLPAFAEKVHASQILLLSYDEEVLKNNINCSEKIIDSVFWNRKQAEELMAYYTLQIFTNNLIIASLEEPEGRKGRNLIGINGITEEETVAIGILGIKEIYN